ncbi:XRE family transcriptional regulator [Saccharothrix syringae]|uniref:XRE family transcriptional regulator n=1 Tax=Saccharothrix syringae TaxID=103733 RepID=A0A5Q0HAV0_SACSY|nr:XRE family transcriptional regulator [Saccharothrix syringae]
MGAKRQCRGCGARLAADNRAWLCAACGRRDAQASCAPVKPVDFWATDEFREAFASRHFGRIMRAYRFAHTPALTQARLGRWLGLSQGHVSHVEAGRTPPSDLVKLERWARALRVPEALLWFRFQEASVESLQERRGRSFGWFTAGAPVPAVERVVGTPDVETLRAMTRTFRQLDNRFGGGHARATVSQYLVGEAVPLLRAGRFRDGVRRELFGAVAEMNQLAGWMAYDVGDVDAGRKHLRQALRLCKDVGDDALAAEMLAGMSHHAAFFRSPLVAVDLARGARDSASRTGLGVLQAEAAVMEAHGLALQRDSRKAVAVLREAEALFSAAEGSSVPEWLGYFDAAYLAAKFAHCFRDLGRSDEAEGFARRSLEMSEGYERGRLFNTALLASILADQRRVEEACEVGLAALRMAVNLNSVRTVTYLADVAARLAPFAGEPVAGELFAEMRAMGIVGSAEGQDV